MRYSIMTALLFAAFAFSFNVEAKKLTPKFNKAANKPVQRSRAQPPKFKLGKRGQLSTIFNGKKTFKPNTSSQQFKLGKGGALSKKFNFRTGLRVAPKNNNFSKPQKGKSTFNLDKKNQLRPHFSTAAKAPTQKQVKPNNYRLGEKNKLRGQYNTASGQKNIQRRNAPSLRNQYRFKLGEKNKLRPMFRSVANNGRKSNLRPKQQSKANSSSLTKKFNNASSGSNSLSKKFNKASGASR